MSVDASSLSDYINITSGSVTVIGGALGFYLKYVVIPNHNFRKKIMTDLATVQQCNVENLKKIEDNKKDVDKLEKVISSHEKTLDDEIDNLKENFDKEVANLKENHKELSTSFDNQINRLEDRNEKLLDLIVKYFAGNN